MENKYIVLLAVSTILTIGFASAQSLNEIEGYENNPRVYYDFSGSATDVCERWKNGEVSTSYFQTATSRGEGTAELTEKPMYEGYPREYYKYSGDEIREHSEWLVGDQSTRSFITGTERGEGVASLERVPLYEGYPRSYYEYTGNSPDMYNEWKNGEISTDAFITGTDRGEGVNALNVDSICVGSDLDNPLKNSDGGAVENREALERLSEWSTDERMINGEHYSYKEVRTGMSWYLDYQEAEPPEDLTVAHSPEVPGTGQETTITAETANQVDQISIYVDNQRQDVCENTDTCSITDTAQRETEIDYYATAESGPHNSETQVKTLEVRDIGYPEINLDITHSPTNPETGDQITFEAETQSAVSTISIYVDGNEVESCQRDTADGEGSNCRYQTSFDSQGSHTYYATAESSEQTAETVVKRVQVEDNEDSSDPGPEGLSSSVSPSNPRIGEEVTLRAGTDNEVDQLRLFVDGNEINSCSEVTSCTGTISFSSESENNFYAVAELNSQSDRSRTTQIDVQDDGGGGGEPPEPPEQTVTYNLDRGWNLVSAPLVNDMDTADLGASEFESCQLRRFDDGGLAYGYPSESGDEYSVRETASAMQGYWVRADSSCSVDIPVESMISSGTDPELESGWNLISVKERTSLSSVEGDCNFRQVERQRSGVAYGYNPDWEQYELFTIEENLNPKKGYWVAVESSCTLSSSGSSGPPSPP